METSTLLLCQRQTTRPLLSCEARARVAFENGLLSEAAYQSLAGITAEALRAQQEEEGCASGSSSEEVSRRELAMCDTPPLVRGCEGSSRLLQEDAAVSSNLQLTGEYYTNIKDEGGVVMDIDQPHDEYVKGSQHYNTMNALGVDSDQSHLEVMEEQGFGLSTRAARMWARENDGHIASFVGSIEGGQDRRLLQFVDICLKTYPQSDPAKTPDMSEHSRDFTRQNHLASRVPSQKSAAKNEIVITRDKARREVQLEIPHPVKTVQDHVEKSCVAISINRKMEKQMEIKIQDPKPSSGGSPVLPETLGDTNNLLSKKNRKFLTKDRFPIDKKERKRAMDRERKARWRAKQPAEKRLELNNKTREAMAKRRSQATAKELERIRAVARLGMRKHREKMSTEERQKWLARERERKARKKMLETKEEREARTARNKERKRLKRLQNADP